MLFDDIKLVVSEVDDSWLLESIDACERLDEMCRQYDELAPTPEMWANAHGWANWYTIDANGDAWFDENEPVLGLREWKSYDNNYDVMPTVVIPLGIPWTLCKWRRPEVTK